MIKQILFPFDFSEQGSLAAPFVRNIACRFGAQVTVISVVPPLWDVPPLGMPVLVPLDTEETERHLRERLDAVLTNELAGVSVERVVERGDPALMIAEFAHSKGVDLIMMPTHGSGLFRSLLLGSVTSKVLHDADCPVWTATHAEEQRSPEAPRNILCSVDGGPETVKLMRWAADFSRQMGADLKLMHVVPKISDWLALPSERELQEQMREEGRKQIVEQQKAAGVDAPLRVGVGSVTDMVTEEARQENADLLLIGRGTLQSTLGRLRTHAFEMIQRSPCPVLSV